MSMKPLEDTFFKACVHEALRVEQQSERELSVRNIVNIFSRLGFPHKQLWGYITKWDTLGFYNYGVTLDLGWFEFDKLTPRYNELYQEVVNANGVTKWEDGEFADYVNKETAKRTINKQFGAGRLAFTRRDVTYADPTANDFMDAIRQKVIEATGIPAELLGLTKNKDYVWVDIVNIHHAFYLEVHHISGKRNENGEFDIREFINAVAEKYDVTPEDIRTFLRDKIDITDANIPVSDILKCGCYVDDGLKWTIGTLSKGDN